jgi:ATP-dependent DNA helicase RecG
MINVRENVLFWNEGGLPFGLSLEDLKSEHNSRPRNPLIANACFFAGYIDTWGRGTLKIIDACLKAGLPEPVIREMNGGVQITIFLSEVAESGLVDDENSDSKGGQVGGTIGGTIEEVIGGTIEEVIGGQTGGQTGEIEDVITERQKVVLNLIVENNRISRKEIAKALGIAESAVQKHLKALIDAKAICREGTYKGYWKILIKS